MQKNDDDNEIQILQRLAGVGFSQNYWANLLFIIPNALICTLSFALLVQLNQFLKILNIIDLDGFWLPILLFTIAKLQFEQFYYNLMKKLPSGIIDPIKIVVYIISNLIWNLGFPLGLYYLAFKLEKAQLARTIEMVLSFLPQFAGSFSLVKICYRQRYAVAFQNTDTNSWGPNGCLYQIVGLSTSIVILPIITILFGNCKSRRQPQRGQIQEEFLDSDVSNEAERVKQEKNSDLISVDQLYKEYIGRPQANDQQEENQDLLNQGQQANNGVLAAVKGISFGVQKQESFILLGVNGAGKSTTFKCLTGQEQITSGEIIIDGQNLQDVIQDPRKVENLIGYCAQTNMFIPEFTVLENLVFFTKINGLVGDYERYAEYMAKKFQINKFKDTQASKLSGGNQRKLCTAIAMIGKKPAIFLDESSAGVDPFSRRKLWKTIREQSCDSALIVTTHSMEEAEALGTKMAIMVDGRFKCFGTVQSIKQKFGQGFKLEIKLDQDQIDDQISNLRSSKILETQGDSIKPMTFEEIKDIIDEWFKQDLEQINKSQKGTSTFLQFDKEFSSHGLLSNFYKLVQEGQKIDLTKLLRQIIYINEITLILYSLEQEFMFATLENYVGNKIEINLPRPGDKSIGYLFGFMENLLNQHLIKDYSAQQSTLEQIFNSFAKQKNLQSFNKSYRVRKATLKENN